MADGTSPLVTGARWAMFFGDQLDLGVDFLHVGVGFGGDGLQAADLAPQRWQTTSAMAFDSGLSSTSSGSCGVWIMVLSQGGVVCWMWPPTGEFCKQRSGRTFAENVRKSSRRSVGPAARFRLTGRHRSSKVAIAVGIAWQMPGLKVESGQARRKPRPCDFPKSSVKSSHFPMDIAWPQFDSIGRLWRGRRRLQVAAFALLAMFLLAAPNVRNSELNENAFSKRTRGGGLVCSAEQRGMRELPARATRGGLYIPIRARRASAGAAGRAAPSRRPSTLEWPLGADDLLIYRPSAVGLRHQAYHDAI